jgi:hypothetical protein
MARSIEEILAEKRASRTEAVATPEKEAHNPAQVISNVEKPKEFVRKRNVFNGTQAKLSVNETIPGYHLHVFTDTGNRIKDALEGGYEFVSPSEVGGVSENVVSRNGDLGQERIRYLVNPRAEGSEQYGYLMKIREEWFLEDQNILQEKNAQIDLAIRKGKITGGDPSFYVPKNGINLKS